MRFYYIPGSEEASHFATLSEAASVARDIAKRSYHDIEVILVEVGTTKDNVLRMLNGGAGVHETIDTVYVTRGRLKGKAT